VFPNTNPEGNSDSDLTYYTSVVDTNDSPILTLQAQFTDYYGNIVIEGSTIVDGDWYPILNATYSNVSDTKGYVVQGYHPYVRMQFESNNGAVTNILSR
jgi:hypothetical protein